MKVTMHLKVDGESFFRVLRDSLAYDIGQAKGKKPKLSNVHEGYSYKKYLRGKKDKAHMATVRIESFDVPNRYRCSVTSSQGVNRIGYDVVACEDGGIDATYVEEFEPAPGISGMLNRLVGTLKSPFVRGGVKEQMRQIEGTILADRYADGIEEGDEDDGESPAGASEKGEGAEK